SARGIEAFEDLGRTEGRVDVRHWILEAELALLHELHGGHRGDGLGHGGDAEHAVRGHGRRLVERAHAESALVEHPLVRPGHGAPPGAFPGSGGGTEDAADGGTARHGASLSMGSMRYGGDGSEGRGSLQDVATGRRYRRHGLFLPGGSW